MKKLLLVLLFIFSFTSLFAQSVLEKTDENLRSSNKIYVVITIIVAIFIGISIYLFSIDKRLKKIEKEK